MWRWLGQLVEEIFYGDNPCVTGDLKPLNPPWLLAFCLLLAFIIGVLVARGQELKPRPAAGPEVSSLEIHIRKGSRSFDHAAPERLYYATCLAVADKLGSKRELRPSVQLTVGAKQEAMREDVVKGHLFLVDLQEWDEQKFVAAMLEACTDALITPQQKLLLLSDVVARERVEAKYGTVSVDAIRKEKR